MIINQIKQFYNYELRATILESYRKLIRWIKDGYTKLCQLLTGYPS